MRSTIEKQTLRGSDGRLEDVWPLPNDEAFLLKLFTELFDDHHDKISWGPLLAGAAYELKSPSKPVRISHSDGYLTVHWGDKGHFHLCIGDIRVPAGRANAEEIIAQRRPGRVELFRGLDRDGYPHSWGLRMFNAKDEPQIAVFFPNPYVTDFDEVTNDPDWSRIELWEDILPRYTGGGLDGLDRQGRGFGRY